MKIGILMDAGVDGQGGLRCTVEVYDGGEGEAEQSRQREERGDKRTCTQIHTQVSALGCPSGLIETYNAV